MLLFTVQLILSACAGNQEKFEMMPAVFLETNRTQIAKQGIGLLEKGEKITKDLLEEKGKNTKVEEQVKLSDKEEADRNREFIIEQISPELMVAEKDGVEDILFSYFAVSLPEGWDAKLRENENKKMQCIIKDVHNEESGEEDKKHVPFYEHEIIITAYEISGMPENPLRLVERLKQYFTVPVLYSVEPVDTTAEIAGTCWLYGKNRQKQEFEYFFFADCGDDRWELYHVAESTNTSIDYEIESFGDFLDEGLVTITNKIEKKTYGREQKAQDYFLWKGSANEQLLVVMEWDRDVVIHAYKRDDYSEPISTVAVKSFNPGHIIIKDLDMDGDDDFLYKYWETEIAKEGENDFEGCIWDEEKQRFTQLSHEEMLKQSIFLQEAQKTAQEEFALSEEKIQAAIPKELIGYLSEYLLKSREELQTIMQPMVSDRELTIEEVQALAADNPCIKSKLLEIASCPWGMGTWLKTDADNDGVTDVFLCEYLGGSLGSVYYSLFQGQEDGSYLLTDERELLKEEFAFITFEGKQYMARTTWEFTKKLYDGIALDYYENGQYQGTAWIKIAEKTGEGARSTKLVYMADERYEKLCEGLNAFSLKYDSDIEEPVGTAEQEIETTESYDRLCDIDNDGEDEYYHSYIWMSSNYYTVDYLIFSMQDEEKSNRINDVLFEDETGVPLYVWVDETDFGNITYVLQEDGLYDFHINGFLITKDNYVKVIQTNCSVQTQIEVDYRGKETFSFLR